ncbi:hypothetical protein HDU85_000854 [Gaertneriomyces sp. JEL0708]|nr:hypothetical protein HDU85_000854 [Gaertneriomyces sp. JEL0708]
MNHWHVVRHTGPILITVYMLLWIVLQLLNASVLLIPQFWSFGLVLTIFVSCCGFLGGLPSVLNYRPTRHWALMQVTVVALTAWIVDWNALTILRICGVAIACTGTWILSLHLQHDSHYSSIPTSNLGGSLRTPGNMKRLIARIGVVCCVGLIVLWTATAWNDSYQPRNDSLPIPGFTDIESLHLPGKNLLSIQRIYAINTASRHDRRKELVVRLHALGLGAYIVPATTIASPLVESRSSLLNGWGLFGSRLTTGELARTISHLRVMQNVVDEHIDRVVVLEDNVMFDSNISQLWQTFSDSVPADADIVYLGRCKGGPGTIVSRLPHTQTINLATAPCSDAYVLTGTGAQSILSLLATPRQSFDDAIVSLIELGLVRAYSVHPPLIDTDPESSRDVDVRDGAIGQFLESIGSWLRGFPPQKLSKPVVGAEMDYRWADSWLAKSKQGVWHE